MNLKQSVAAVEVPPVVAGVIKVLPKKTEKDNRIETLEWYLVDFSAYCRRNWNRANSKCEVARLHYETLSESVNHDWVSWEVKKIKEDGFSDGSLPLLDGQEPLAMALRKLLKAELAYSLYKNHLATQRKFFRLCNELVPAHGAATRSKELIMWIEVTTALTDEDVERGIARMPEHLKKLVGPPPMGAAPETIKLLINLDHAKSMFISPEVVTISLGLAKDVITTDPRDIALISQYIVDNSLK
jgi:hypothetical protein